MAEKSKKTPYVVKTEYMTVVYAESNEQAEEIAMKDLQGRNGLDGKWVWSENVSSSNHYSY